MTVEVATYINDLQPVNPASTDQVSQGDDHLRLIKQVLQNTFLNATRAFTVPLTLAVSTTGTITKNAGEGTVYVATTGGAVTLTLPTLTALDAGWKCHFIKTTADANPVFIKAAAGSVSSGGYSVTQARRCITGARCTAVWDGTNWFITRALALPIGSLLSYYSTTLPAGYEWPNGQTLVSAATNYQEYNTANGSGVTPDVRGYAELAMDNLGGGTPAGRLPNGFIAGSTLGAVGGVDGVTLTSNQMPAHQHSISLRDPGHGHTIAVTNSSAVGNDPRATGGNAVAGVLGNESTNTPNPTTGITIGQNSPNFNDGTVTSTGGGLIHSNLQPSIMLGKLLIVE